jgi:hypothetical protein
MNKKVLATLIVIGISVGLTSCSQSSETTSSTSGSFTVSPEDTAAAMKSAGQWLALVDQGKYADSWTTMSAWFKSQMEQQAWDAAVQKTRKGVGKLAARKMSSSEAKRNLKGCPPGQYLVIKYDSKFAGNKVETVYLMKENGAWLVTGYRIKDR